MLRSGGSRRRERKRRVVELLRRRDREAVADLVAADAGAVQVLFSLLYEKDERLRWRAIEAVGFVAARTAESDLETVRDWVRRQVWAMNEESGNMAWFAPETISEICLRVPGLLREYGRILMANLEEPVFRRGCFFAMARMAVVDPEPFEDLEDEAAGALCDPLPLIRASAAVVLGALGRADRLEGADPRDPATIRLYDVASGEMVSVSVGRCIRAARGGQDLEKLMEGQIPD